MSRWEVFEPEPRSPRKGTKGILLVGLALLTICGPVPGFGGQAARRRASALARLPSPLPLALATGSLVISPGSLLFAATNPNTQPVVSANTVLNAAITITGTRPARTWTLTVQSLGPTLISGTDTIPIGNVRWTASGVMTSGNGTLTVVPGPVALSSTAVTTASGSEGNQEPFGATVTYSFQFLDSWDFVPGNYSQTALFTLTAP